MREHAPALGPQPDDDELLVLTSREVHESVDPASDSDDSAALDVFAEKLRRVPCFPGLLGRDAALVPARHFVEATPRGFAGDDHAQNVTVGLVLCKSFYHT